MEFKPDVVLPAKYKFGYDADEANEKLYKKVKNQAGYKGFSPKLPKEIED